MKPILLSFIVVFASAVLFAASTSPDAAWLGGLPVVTLERPAHEGADKPYFKRLQVLPGRGMNTFQIITYRNSLTSFGLTNQAGQRSVEQQRKGAHPVSHVYTVTPISSVSHGVADRIAPSWRTVFSCKRYAKLRRTNVK